MKTKEIPKIILESDPDIITYKTDISGWVSSTGKFYGNNKDMAIYDSITHKKCECGNLMEKYYTACFECRHKVDVERYNNLPFKEWDGTGLVYSRLADKYFYDGSEIEGYCNDEDITPEDLQLVLTDPCYIPELTGEQWDDLLPEDIDRFPKAVEEAMRAFNKAVKGIVISYFPAKIRTSITVK